MLEGLANSLARGRISELEPTIALGQDAQASGTESRRHEPVWVLECLAEVKLAINRKSIMRL